jgi:hypothetical protein
LGVNFQDAADVYGRGVSERTIGKFPSRVRLLAWLLEDTSLVKRVTLAEGVYAYLNSGPDRAVAAITTGPIHAAYQLPSAAGVESLDLFGNPLPAGTAIDVHVDRLAQRARVNRAWRLDVE